MLVTFSNNYYNTIYDSSPPAAFSYIFLQAASYIWSRLELLNYETAGTLLILQYIPFVRIIGILLRVIVGVVMNISQLAESGDVHHYVPGHFDSHHDI